MSGLLYLGFFLFVLLPFFFVIALLFPYSITCFALKVAERSLVRVCFLYPFFLKTFYIVDFHKTAPNMQWDLMFSQIFDWQISCRCLFYSLILLVYTLFHFVIQTLYIFLSPYSFSSGFAFFSLSECFAMVFQFMSHCRPAAMHRDKEL